MAVITSASSGNFSAPATWVGGVVPGVSDDAVAATGHTVTIDVDVIVISVQQAGTGKFTLGNGRTLTGNVIANAGTFTTGGTVDVTATTTAIINGNVTGVSSTANNVAGVVVSGTGALTINGSVTGSAGNGASEALGSSAVYTNVNSTITINGAVTGGTGNHKRALQAGASSNSIITITGNVGAASTPSNNYGLFFQGNQPSITIFGTVFSGTVGSCYGVYTTGTGGSINVTGNVTACLANPSIGNACIAILTTASTITVTGNVTGAGESFGQAHGISSTATSASILITGDVTAGLGASGVRLTGASASLTITGNITGFGANGPAAYASGASSTINVIGSATAASTLGHAVRCDATSNGVIMEGNMTDSPQGAVAIYTRVFRMSATNSGVTKYANTIGFPNGTLVSRVSPNNVTGMPTVTNVRKPVVYGFNNELTGTMAVPSAQSVAYGVPVNNTTGTAEFDLGRVAQIVGLQVAAGKSV